MSRLNPTGIPVGRPLLFRLLRHDLELEAFAVLDVQRDVLRAAGMRVAIGEQLIPAVRGGGRTHRIEAAG